MLEIKVKAVRDGAELPAYQTSGSSGFDLKACLGDGFDHIEIKPGQRAIVPTGLAFEIPSGLEMQIRSRSGMAAKTGVIVLNEPGTVDSDYRGEVKVILYNTGDEPFIVSNGMRVAQGVICPVIPCKFRFVDKLSETERDDGGFGSTGL